MCPSLLGIFKSAQIGQSLTDRLFIPTGQRIPGRIFNPTDQKMAGLDVYICLGKDPDFHKTLL